MPSQRTSRDRAQKRKRELRSDVHPTDLQTRDSGDHCARSQSCQRGLDLQAMGYRNLRRDIDAAHDLAKPWTAKRLRANARSGCLRHRERSGSECSGSWVCWHPVRLAELEPAAEVRETGSVDKPPSGLFSFRPDCSPKYGRKRTVNDTSGRSARVRDAYPQFVDAVTSVPPPLNEPNLSYAPGSPERKSVEQRLGELYDSEPVEFTAAIGAEKRRPGGESFTVTMPSDHAHVLGRSAHHATAAGRRGGDRGGHRGGFARLGGDGLRRPGRDLPPGRGPAGRAVARHPQRGDDARPGQDGAAGRDRRRLRADRLPGASTSPSRARSWPTSRSRLLGSGTAPTTVRWTASCYAITPFNFTAIAGNLPTAPALMGNTVLWKPSPTQQLAAHYTYALLEAAGLPPGVINLLPGDGIAVSDVALQPSRLRRAALHRIDGHLPAPVADASATNLTDYRCYPRIVGETGGKDFIVAHPSADPDVLRTAMIRGSFEYSGQKCSAVLPGLRAPFGLEHDRGRPDRADRGAAVGDVRDFSNFTSAVIDDRAFAKHRDALERARAGSSTEIVGRRHRRRQRRLVRPTVGDRQRRPAQRDLHHRVLRPDPRRVRLRRRRLRRRADRGRPGGTVRADRRGDRPTTGHALARAASSGCGSRPATSTSTTSRPARWWGSSRSAVPAPPAPTTRPARCGT